jgi:hypothetical protein
VTGFAPIHPCGGVFEEKRTALVNMALQTRLLVLQTGFDHVRPTCHLPRRGIRAVGIVTIRAVHDSLVHPVLEGLGELRADITMTAVTDLALTLRKQVLRPLGLMDRMTRNAGDISLGVLTTSNIGPVRILGVTPKTRIQHLSGRQCGKRYDGGLTALRSHVFPAGAMAAFASAILLVPIPCNDGLEMWITVELERDVWMTSPASVTANELRGTRAGRGRSLRMEHSSQQASAQQNCPIDRSENCHEPFLPI